MASPGIGQFFYWFTIGTVAAIAWTERKYFPAIIALYRSLDHATVARGALLAIGTAATAALAVWLAPEALMWGWPKLFGVTAGNILLTPVTTPAASPMQTPLPVPPPPGFTLAAVALLLTVLSFLVILLYVMPGIVRREEDVFRRGVVTHGRMVFKSLAFGFSHLLVGLPIVAGLVLSLPGYILARTYRTAHLAALASGMSETDAAQAGAEASTRLHLAYNATLILSVGLGIATILLLAIIGLLLL
jgi:hypothetical protein